jgi:2-dehydropantoate 2-reductase
MKKVGIVGGGSIGLALAGYLSKGQFEVTVYTKAKQQADHLHKNGVTLKIGTSDFTFPINSTPFLETTELVDDLLFIAVKQYHLKEVVSHLMHLKGKLSTIAFLQNGMGHLTYLDKLGDKADNILVGIVEHGALKHSLTEVEHTGDGEMKIGFFQKKSDFSSTVWLKLSCVGFRTTVHEDWFQIMVSKLLVNGVINPLTAIFKVKNGDLITNEYYFKIMRKLFDEISLIYNSTEADWQKIVDICKKTSQNRSSMLKDIEEGRETEIEAITGVILEKAANQNVQLHYHNFIYHSIKGIESQRKGAGTFE